MHYLYGGIHYQTKIIHDDVYVFSLMDTVAFRFFIHEHCVWFYNTRQHGNQWIDDDQLFHTPSERQTAYCWKRHAVTNNRTHPYCFHYHRSCLTGGCSQKKNEHEHPMRNTALYILQVIFSYCHYLPCTYVYIFIPVFVLLLHTSFQYKRKGFG